MCPILVAMQDTWATAPSRRLDVARLEQLGGHVHRLSDHPLGQVCYGSPLNSARFQRLMSRGERGGRRR